MDRKILAAIATLTGTIIGAGFLGIPYVVSQAGFFTGLFWIIFLGGVMCYLRLLLGEVILRTNNVHQLVGYGRIYLGMIGKIMLSFSMIFGIYAALIAYLIGEATSMSFLFAGTTKHVILFGLLFWFIATVLSFNGIKALRFFEPAVLGFVFLIFFLILFYFAPILDFSRLTAYSSGKFFVPFGIVLFSFMGTAILSEIRRMLKKEEKTFEWVILIGSFIPIVAYSLFTLVVNGSFSVVPEVATIALGKVFVSLGIFTMLTAFLSLSVVIKDMWIYDFSLKERNAWLLASMLPLLLFLLIRWFSLAGFITVLTIGGSVAGGVEAIAILLLAWKAKQTGERMPEYKVPLNKIVIVLLFALFVIGLVYSVL